MIFSNKITKNINEIINLNETKIFLLLLLFFLIEMYFLNVFAKKWKSDQYDDEKLKNNFHKNLIIRWIIYLVLMYLLSLFKVLDFSDYFSIFPASSGSLPDVT